MMKDNSLIVSIIMNCHNGESFLKQSIDSIINQSFKNWELIFFDNVSDDNSLEIVESFNDKRIKVFKSEKFINLYHARNEAIQKAKGKYICFLDTDDYWERNKIEEQVNFLENNRNFEMVYSNFYTIKKDNTKYIQNNYNLPEGKIVKDLLKKYSIGILTACIKKKIFENILFDEKTNIIGDFDFFVKLSCDYNIGCIQKPLAFYRDHENNLSKKKLGVYINELKYWIKNNNKRYKKLGISLINIKILLFKLRLKNFLKILGV